MGYAREAGSGMAGKIGYTRYPSRIAQSRRSDRPTVRIARACRYHCGRGAARRHCEATDPRVRSMLVERREKKLGIEISICHTFQSAAARTFRAGPGSIKVSRLAEPRNLKGEIRFAADSQAGAGTSAAPGRRSFSQ